MLEKIESRDLITHGDLLESETGQRHRGIFLKVAKNVWPRALIFRVWPSAGLFMLVEVIK